LVEALELPARGALERAVLFAGVARLAAVERTVLFARVARVAAVERRVFALFADVDWAVGIWEAVSYSGGTLVLVDASVAPNTCS
jgi:hypothetical protein